MNKIIKSRLMIFTSVFLLLTMLGAQFVTSSAADPAIIRVPEDYSTIQEAVNAANPEDIVQVAAGTYYENVVVNKSLSLIGENRSTTIIDGNWTYDVVLNVTADSVKITGFTIQNAGDRWPPDVPTELRDWIGIHISSSSNIISGNIVSRNIIGIVLNSSSGNTINGNVISPYSAEGISLWGSHGNIIKDNKIDPGPGLP